MSNMKAWQIAAPGDVLTNLALNKAAPRPSASSIKNPTDILVNVASAALNPADYKVPAMGLAARGITSFPKTPGMDIAGTVAAVGPGVTDLLVGDHVMARVDPLRQPGGLSEAVIAHAGAYAKISRTVKLDDAAAVGTAGLTAYQTIKPYVKPGDRVFINGGSGGVGTFGIQIAKLLGCHVSVSCSTAKVDLCRELGADQVFDYKKVDLVEELANLGRVFSLVVDNVGTSPPNLYSKCGSVLLPSATFVIVSAGANMGNLARSIDSLVRPAFLGGGKNKVVMYLTKNNQDDWNTLAAWVNQGKLRSVIDKTYEMEEVVEAFAYLKKGSAAGKIIIHVEGKQ